MLCLKNGIRWSVTSLGNMSLCSSVRSSPRFAPRNDGIFDLLRHAILQYRLLAADLLQRQLAAFVIEFLKAVEAVAAIAHHLAGLADIAELLGELQEPNLGG